YTTLFRSERGQGEQLRFDRHGGGAWRKPRILLRLPASSLVGAAGAARPCSFSSISRSGQRQGLAAAAAPTGTSVAAAYPDGLASGEHHGQAALPDRTRQHGRTAGARRRAVGCADAAGGRELPGVRA